MPGPKVAGAGVGDTLDVLPQVRWLGISGGSGEPFGEFDGARMP